MTVKDIIPLLAEAKEIFLGWDGLIRKIDPQDALDMDAYGRYVVKKITATKEDIVELSIAARPITE